jgi:hypothetical protein
MSQSSGSGQTLNVTTADRDTLLEAFYRIEQQNIWLNQQNEELNAREH